MRLNVPKDRPKTSKLTRGRAWLIAVVAVAVSLALGVYAQVVGQGDEPGRDGRSSQALATEVGGVASASDATATVSAPTPPLGKGARLSAAAIERTRHRVRYDGSYRSIPYPMGDVPAGIGVCADVVVRVYREIDIDLQERIHQDMKANFEAYPKRWGLRRPDPNIDHRRVPNLETFLRRQGGAVAISDDSTDYRPGDVVSWRLSNGLPHIGLVVDKRTTDGTRPLIVHNIGSGPQIEDVLFAYRIEGHFRWPESPD